jgi:hypothetical protein
VDRAIIASFSICIEHLREIGTINQLVRSVHERHLRSKVELTLEVKIKIEAPEESRKRKAAAMMARKPGDEESSVLGSSPPQAPAKKQSQRTAQSDVRLAQRKLAGNFETQLIDRYKCMNRGCTNYDNYCFVDPNSTTHYNMNAV